MYNPLFAMEHLLIQNFDLDKVGEADYHRTYLNPANEDREISMVLWNPGQKYGEQMVISGGSFGRDISWSLIITHAFDDYDTTAKNVIHPDCQEAITLWKYALSGKVQYKVKEEEDAG